MATSYSGQCHCGAVQYKVNLEKDQVRAGLPTMMDPTNQNAFG